MFDLPDPKKPDSQEKQGVYHSSLLANPDNSVWELIYDSLPDMVALIDLNNTIVKANKAMLGRLKLGDKGIVGHACHTLMHEKGCVAENCPHLSMLFDSKPHTIELYEPKFNCYLSVTTTPVFDSDKKLLGSVHIARDITIQKESEAKLREYNNELNELNQSKDKFFSIVAHDLRSPFQGMLGFTDLILDELDTLTKYEIRDYVQKVHDSSYSTFTLLENLLNWSRLQTGRLQNKPVDVIISEEITSVINLLSSNAQSKNIELINLVHPEYILFADQQMVHSIILNLTTNAIKFTHPGGRIIFDARITDLCEGSISEPDSVNHKCLEISVSDDGVGISPDALEMLFKIDTNFSMLGTSNEQGAGLGLILVKEMVEKQGGHIEVESKLEKGSVFKFTLPLAAINER